MTQKDDPQVDGEDEDDVEDGEGLAEAAEDAGEEPRLGHSPADSATSDEPESDVVDDPDNVDYVELAKIHNVRELGEARLIKGILESFHIPCVVEDDVMSDMLGGVNPAGLDGIDIFVPAEFSARAKLILCERNIVCGIDEGRRDEMLVEAAAAFKDGEKRGALLKKLGEETRDYRHEVLSEMGRREQFELVRALLRDAVHVDDECPVANDIAYLTDLGTFGKDHALIVLAELDKLAKEADPKVRRRVARALGRLRGVGAGPALVDFLLDDDASVRDEALESLYALSQGETFDFDPDLSPAGQEGAITRWRAWVRDNAAA